MSEFLNARRRSAQTFSCPGCGGRPVWDPATRQMKCPFCGTASAIELDQTPPTEYPIEQANDASAQDWGEVKRVVRCEGCGAQTILGKDETATLCPFCGSPHVLDDQSAAGIAPESVLPFAVPKEKAVSGFRAWLKGKPFAPGKAKKLAALGEISGVYLPHWTYDSDTVSQYTGLEGHWYYVTRTRTVTRDGKQVQEQYQERQTRWEPTSGTVSRRFDDVVVAGSERLPENLLQRVQPYNMNELCRYQAGFLSGFTAEKAAVDVHTGWDRAQKRIEGVMHDMAMRDILSHADEAQVKSIVSRHSKVRYKLTLLPMWLSSFQWKDKTYHVLVNGQSGKCGGEAPVSPWRVLALVLFILAVLGVGYYFFMMNGDGGAVIENVDMMFGY